MDLHPMHPAAWVVRAVAETGWQVHDLLSFTRASTLLFVSRGDEPAVVLKAGFGSNHVLARLDEQSRPAAYGFYWYHEMTPSERALSREDFRHEIAATRAVSGGDHLVPLLEQGSHDDFDWYTMPYCTGGNLRPLMSQLATNTEPSRVGSALAVLADTARGLIALHDGGFVHRDVYQENILIHNGHGMLTDLGAARQMTIPRGPAQRGPEVHWPPEYATSYHLATPAADVYSLAVLGYRILCGDLPRLHGAAQLRNLPEPIGAVLSAGLAPSPEHRPSMAELHHALRYTAASAPQPAA